MDRAFVGIGIGQLFPLRKGLICKEDFDSGRFGYLYVSSGKGKYIDWDGSFYSILLNGTVYPDHHAVKVEIIDAEDSTKYYGSFSIQYDSPESWGFFVDSILGEVPNYISHSYDDQFPGLIIISGHSEEGDDSFSFEIVTRPWGVKWDDIAETRPNNLPLNYYDWYLPLIESGSLMPN